MFNSAGVSEDGIDMSHLAEEIDQLRGQNAELWKLLDTIRQENSQVGQHALHIKNMNVSR